MAWILLALTAGVLAFLFYRYLRNRRSLEAFDQMLETTSDMVQSVDPSGRLLFVNDAWLKTLGYRRDEVLGKSVFDFIAPEHREPCRAFFKRLPEEKRFEGVPVAFVRSDGTSIEVEGNVAMGFDANGRPSSTVGFFRDFSRREKAERQVHQFFEAAIDLHAIVALDGTVKKWSASWEKILGLSEAVLRSRDWLDFIHPDDVEATREAVSRLRSGETVTLFENRFLDQQGNYHWLLWNVTTDSQEGLVYASAREIQDLKDAQVEVDRAYDRATRAARLKTEFVANVSHEIRTPMNGVIGLADLLRETKLEPQQAEYVEAIRRSGVDLLAIINDILDFSKLESGKLSLQDSNFDLGELLDDAIETIGPLVAKKPVDLYREVDPGAPKRVTGDAVRLRQVLLNLLGNAAKFTERGEIVLRIGVETELSSSIKIRFSVEDSGSGIEPGRLEEIFEPFSQADGALTRRHGGTGLGLAISRQIVSQMGGVIEAFARPEGGTRIDFSVVLGRATREGKSAFHCVTDSRIRVKIVDPNARRGKAISSWVEEWGFAPDRFESVEGCGAQQGGEGETVFHIVAAEAWKDGAEENTPPPEASIVFGKEPPPRLRGAAFLAEPLRERTAFEALMKLAAPERSASESASEERTSKPQDRIRRILVAEDHPVNQMIFRKMLARLGFEIEIARNGKEAIERSEKEPYSLILMDLQMPEMDGYEAIQRIRQREKEGDPIPIFAVTAHGMPEERQRALDSGANGVLLKPLRLEALRGLLEGIEGREEEESVPGDAPEAEDEAVLSAAAVEGLKRLDGGGDFFPSLVKAFLEDSPKRIERCRKALEDEDAELVRKCAHALKGGARTFGGEPFGAACETLEEAAEREDWEALPSSMNDLRERYDELAEALNKLIT